MLEPLALLLAFIHFGFPLTYYFYAKKKWLSKPWSFRVDENYRPRVTIIVPTYNEARLIKEKLEDIYKQDYPRGLMDVIVVDSASVDGTPELVEKWAFEHRDLKVMLLRENARQGMVPAINYALRNNVSNGDIVMLTDADAYWPPSALRNIVKYFANEDVKAVTASIVYHNLEDHPNISNENVYRSYYNLLRVAESKKYATPIHNGPLIAFRKNLLYEMGLIPEYTGNDDSTPASIIAFMGYRAIQVEDVVVKEYVRRSQFRRRVRRAQHLILHFLKTKKYVKERGLYRHNEEFEVIWNIEQWLHVVNPWILVTSFALLILSLIANYSISSFILLIAGASLLKIRVYRIWILQQLCLIIASIKNLRSKDILWHE
ncbi:MAG: glycosyltransferase [Thermoproteota archaeon]|nr:glycosyltransferase [Candidatus Brockarchaeota archaeon]